MSELAGTPWVDRTWRNVWERLSTRVDDSWLPDAKGEGRKLSVHEYGKGSWGVVSPTNELGIVCKLTTDPSEALFVSWILSAEQPDEGLVKYHRIYELAGHTFRNRKIYALWRSEAWNVGDPMVNLRPSANLPSRGPWKDNQRITDPSVQSQFDLAVRALVLIDEVRASAGMLRKKLQHYRRVLDDAGYRELLERVWNAYQEGGGRDMRTRELAAMLEAEHTQYSSPVGNAMRWCVQDGVVLADVHRYNIGHDHPATGSWIITDPGHAVVVNPAVVIPPIEVV